MILQILTLLGSLAMFLYGMSLMSGGLQKMAGNRMRTVMDHNLSTPIIELGDINNADAEEKAINEYRDRLREEHLSSIEIASYPYETGSFYMDVVNSLEKMGDFIINISQSIIGAKA